MHHMNDKQNFQTSSLDFQILQWSVLLFIIYGVFME